MLNIPVYKKYSGEKKIALLDNSTVSFMLQLENSGHSPERLLKEYDVIFIPGWVVEEIQDSEFRIQYIEKLVQAGIPIQVIEESFYSDLMDGVHRDFLNELCYIHTMKFCETVPKIS